MRTIYCQTDVHVEINSLTLKNINLDGFYLHRAILEYEDMSGSSFVGCELRNAVLFRADLSRANLSEANLIMADLRGVKGISTTLIESSLLFSKLDFADFTGASFLNSNVRDASFVGAILDGADMRCENLNTTNLYGIKYDEKTIWPEGFKPNDIYIKEIYQ